MSSRRALIVEDGLGSYVLPAVRSLGRGGWTVGLGGPRRSRSAASRWVKQTHHIPPAEHDLDAFRRAVTQAIDEGGYDVVFGGDDVEVLALSAVRDQLRAVVPYAAHGDVVRSIDKLELSRAAEAAGIAVPRSAEATAAAVAATELPVFVKARLHWTPGASGDRGRLTVAECTSRAEVEEAVASIVDAGGSAILQSPVAGDLTAVTALCARGGRIVALAQQRATRISPRARTSTRAVTVEPGPEIADAARRLLADLGWFGIVNLQLLAPADGPPRLIDLNGRFYGSLALAIAGGLDLPLWWAQLAMGAEFDGCRVGRAGVRYQALEEDLYRARRRPVGHLVGDVIGTLAAAPRAAHSTWDRRDPRPSAVRAGQLLRRVGPSRLSRGDQGT